MTQPLSRITPNAGIILDKAGDRPLKWSASRIFSSNQQGSYTHGIRTTHLQCPDLSGLGSRAGLEPERCGTVYLPRNPDPGFTPGSGSNSVAIDRNQNARIP